MLKVMVSYLKKLECNCMYNFVVKWVSCVEGHCDPDGSGKHIMLWWMHGASLPAAASRARFIFELYVGITLDGGWDVRWFYVEMVDGGDSVAIGTGGRVGLGRGCLCCGAPSVGILATAISAVPALKEEWVRDGSSWRSEWHHSQPAATPMSLLFAGTSAVHLHYSWLMHVLLLLFSGMLSSWGAGAGVSGCAERDDGYGGWWESDRWVFPALLRWRWSLIFRNIHSYDISFRLAFSAIWRNEEKEQEIKSYLEWQGEEEGRHTSGSTHLEILEQGGDEDTYQSLFPMARLWFVLCQCIDK